MTTTYGYHKARELQAGTRLTHAEMNRQLKENMHLLANRPSVQVATTGAVAIPTSTYTTVTFDVANWDEYEIWDSTAGDSFYIPEMFQGIWMAIITTEWEADGTANVSHFLEPSLPFSRPMVWNKSLSTARNVLNSSHPVRILGEGNEVAVRVNQTTGSDLNLESCVATLIWEGF